MLDTQRNDLVAGVAGSGTMGRGIVQVLAQCGVRTRVYDALPGAADKARAAIARTLDGLVQKGRVPRVEADATMARIEIVDTPAGFAGAHLVVEAIVEDLEAKRALFHAIEGVVADDCILASNTSSLSVTAMAATCAHPERVAGYHFFNPVPLMRIVEVVAGERTEPRVLDALCALARRFGHTAVRCKDTPGFIVNHAGRGYIPESLRVLSEGVADHATIDRILVDAAGFRLGPFGLMDLVGLDVGHSVMQSLYRQYFDEPRYRPSYLLEPRVAAGMLGRKSGRGWYLYGPDGAAEKPAEPAPPATEARPFWVDPEAGALRDLLARAGAALESGDEPSAAAVCLVTPIGEDATTCALARGLDPMRTVAVDPLFGYSKRRTLMTTPVTRPELRDAAHAALAADGVPVSVIHDSPGFVAQRVVAHIVNIGCDIVQQRIATPEDLDRAVTLGLNYPFGPLAMGDAIGPSRILAVLEAMQRFYQEPRYRPSPWLTRRARLGVSLLTPES